MNFTYAISVFLTWVLLVLLSHTLKEQPSKIVCPDHITHEYKMVLDPPFEVKGGEEYLLVTEINDTLIGRYLNTNPDAEILAVAFYGHGDGSQRTDVEKPW